MESEEILCRAALRWLDESGELGRLNAALNVRVSQSKPPKVHNNPVNINILQLRQISEELAELVVCRPMEAQQVFHHVVHVTSVAIMLQLNNQLKEELVDDTLMDEEGDDQITPGPLNLPPDPVNIPSFYPKSYKPMGCKSECKKDQMDDTIDLEITVDKIDLDMTLQSLASNLPMNASVMSGDIPTVLTPAQIYAPLRVCGLSGVREWSVCGIRDLPLQLDEPRLAVVSGRILSVSLPTSYTKWARYVCSNHGCLGTARDIHVRVFMVGRPEAETIHNHPLCRVCQAPLSEDPSSRELGERRMVVVVPEMKKTGKLHVRVQGMKLVLRDEMSEGIEPGGPIEATVMICPQNFPKLPSLEAILVSPPRPLRPPPVLPPIFRRLVSDRASSPWSLVLTLAYMFAAPTTPAGTFHTLKFALLLSLASCSTEKAGLAVLGVGNNTTLLLRLLWWSAELSPFTVLHSSLNAATAATALDRSKGEVWVRAGSLLRAHGGVCVLGEFSRFKKDFRRKVCHALESGVVQVECPTKLRKRTTYLTYPLRAAAWACYDPSTASTTASSTSTDPDDNFLHVPLGDLTKSITDVFGLVVYTETPAGTCEREAEDVITLHTLLEATKQHSPSSSSKPLLPTDQLKEYLNIVRGIKVTFSASAEKLIRGYYVATRRLRGDCVQGSAVPITAIHTLAQVAASHAKLALRTMVEGWDAAAAVMLCEEALAAHSGYSLLHVTPAPHLPHNTDLHTLVGRKNDERMANFQKSLEMFINTHTGDIPTII